MEKELKGFNLSSVDSSPKSCTNSILMKKYGKTSSYRDLLKKLKISKNNESDNNQS
jgi:hypothetical protein